MMHKKKGKTLGRKLGHRKMLMRNLATSFVLYEKIKTTETKAKELKPIVEKLISKSAKNNLAVRRQLLSFFTDEMAVKKLLDVIGPRYEKRPGGYTRIRKIGNRQGDNAPVVQLELV